MGKTGHDPAGGRGGRASADPVVTTAGSPAAGSSAAANRATGSSGPLTLRPGQVVQEIGWDEDCDEALRTAIEQATGTELVDDTHEDVVDVVLLWWRDGDGDLVDALMDALTDLADGGCIWLLTPKVGRRGHVDPSDVSDAAPTAGLTTTTSISVATDWSATKLVAPRSARGARR